MISKQSCLLASAAFSVFASTACLQAQWTAPTPEELKMTSIKEVPGAPAVYLFKEQITEDGLHMESYYVRLKVLTEGGKDYGTVELPYVSSESGLTVDNIQGRTIHADGTIIPLTDKPYEKVIEKGDGYSIKMKVFSLPAVEVGSILEYRYKLHLDDGYFRSPDWLIQTDLFTRKAHYMWKPTDRPIELADGNVVQSQVAWTPILPEGAAIKQTRLAAYSGNDGGTAQIDLDVHDIPPTPKEQFMPPTQSLSYKVMFYYTGYKSLKEYWANEGKRWSKARDKFIGPGPATKADVKALTVAGETQEQTLRKIYAQVMTFENTDFTRQRSSAEERADGLKNAANADDILTRKRGNGDQLALLFIGMARAAGMKAYLMGVADRRERYFLPGYLSLAQLDDDIAIVNVDGKEMFFDPGQRYTSFGHLSWKHAFTGGLRQVEGGGTEIANTPASSYKDAHLSRIADLKLDDQGSASGTVILGFTGDSALDLRQRALRGDKTSLETALREDLEQQLPGGMEIKVAKIENLDDYEKPLTVNFEVKGPIGSPTGKRLLVPANLFEANSKPKFPESTRDLPVDMHYPTYAQDAVRITLPASLVIESAPTPGNALVASAVAFDTKNKTTPNSITTYRNVTIGRTIFPAESYADLRGFYGKLEAKDQETLVLTRADASAPKPATPGGN